MAILDGLALLSFTLVAFRRFFQILPRLRFEQILFELQQKNLRSYHTCTCFAEAVTFGSKTQRFSRKLGSLREFLV